MNKKLTITGIIIGIMISTITIVSFLPNSNDTDNLPIERYDNGTFTKIYDVSYKTLIVNNTIYVTPKAEDEGVKTIAIPITKLLFDRTYHLNEDQTINYSEIKPHASYAKLYDEIGLNDSSKKIVFVYPIFTQAAYGQNGFYYYYKGACDSKCLTVDIPSKPIGKYTSSIRTAAVLSILHYPYITDVDIDKNPDILKRYDRVIMLHSEYVTKREFDAITHHPDVVYLYPNALYAEVKTDYNHNTLTLIQGHGYPIASLGNGFAWKFDNTPYEYDNVCDNWKFYKVDNGKMLNCYPSYRLLYDMDLIKAIKQ